MATTVNKVIKKMQELDIYKPEFDETIRRYVKLAREYSTLYARYENGGFQCEVESSSGMKKAPIVTTLEALRRDILNIETALGLTPAGLPKLKENAFKTAKKTMRNELV